MESLLKIPRGGSNSDYLLCTRRFCTHNFGSSEVSQQWGRRIITMNTLARHRQRKARDYNEKKILQTDLDWLKLHIGLRHKELNGDRDLRTRIDLWSGICNTKLKI